MQGVNVFNLQKMVLNMFSSSERLTRNSTPYPEKELRVLINKYCPGIAKKLVIDKPDLYNPYGDLCAETPTHFIYVHSAIEYFFKKIE